MTAAETLSMSTTADAGLPEIFLTAIEHDQLSRLVGDHEATGAAGLLQQELDRATLVETPPPHAVGLDRWVHYSDGRGADPRRVKIVLPQQADIDAGLISALSHVGAGLIGLREGESILWPDPSGAVRKLTPVLVEEPDPRA
ncbi:MAG: GreA/GreB family elongation factor [Brevundimonas sp.]|uniref:GreA/GreB family elongation factor n=1 Tax=Brevundimonas sp. TaxID=1871086 RepID=UPI0027274E54|nr:GreA/GreB family elongation factor [Brevundimonas sp.]MDO9586913.1 GreA/GreB family elongation factor [Brevundimonas sp.]MDZ4112185.1 GreA/GreB family elongation factor [Brevundimonas sp.]